jgi:hypothetical protein
MERQQVRGQQRAPTNGRILVTKTSSWRGVVVVGGAAEWQEVLFCVIIRRYAQGAVPSDDCAV